VQGLETGHTYAFRVRARNAVASSEPTNEVRLYVAEGITGYQKLIGNISLSLIKPL
jgi:hypothetical protein